MFLVKMWYIDICILAASPLASSGFAAIGCFRASPYGGIYILKNYSKLTAKKSANFFFENPNFFLPKTFPWPRQKKISNRSIRSEGDRFQTYILVLYIKDILYMIYISLAFYKIRSIEILIKWGNEWDNSARY